MGLATCHSIAGATRPFGVSNGSVAPAASKWLVKKYWTVLPAGKPRPSGSVTGYVVRGRQRLARHDRVVLLVVLHRLGGVLKVPVLAQVERGVHREPGRLGLEPVVQWQRQIAGGRRHPEVEALVGVERAVVAEAGDVLGIRRGW